MPPRLSHYDPIHRLLWRSTYTSFTMSRVCQVTKRGTRVGGTIARRGLPKYKGGIGLRTTGRNKRKFKVNVQRKRIWVAEIGQHVNVRLSTRALKTIAKNGAYPTLLEAGLVKPAGSQKH